MKNVALLFFFRRQLRVSACVAHTCVCLVRPINPAEVSGFRGEDCEEPMFDNPGRQLRVFQHRSPCYLLIVVCVTSAFLSLERHWFWRQSM